MIFLVLLSGCAAPPFFQRPVPPEQQNAFDAGMKAFYNGEFERAGARFQTFAGRYPDSPLIEEAAWMRARSMEENSGFGEALRAYKLFIKHYPHSRRGGEAAFRIQHLKDFMAQRSAPMEFPRRVGRVWEDDPRGIAGRLSKLLPRERLEGEPVLVIPSAGGEGAYFESRGIPVLDPVLPVLVPEAHAIGWKVWASVEIRRIPGFSAPSKRDGGTLPGTDLFDPSVRARLARFLGDLAQTGVDGIVINDHPLYDPFEGFSPRALEAFQKDFGVSANIGGKPGSVIPLIQDGRISDNPLIWKLSGWRNRETMRRIEELILEIRERFPSLVWAQRLSREAVTEPHETLVRSGENLAQSLQSGVDFFIVPFSFREKNPDPHVFLRKAGEIMAEPRRMILALPMNEREWVSRYEKDLPRVGFFFQFQKTEPLQP